MSNKRRALIAIQARSTSSRLPCKIHMRVGDKRMLDHVIDAAKGARKYLGKFDGNDFEVEVCLVVPVNDPAATAFVGACPVIQGPEQDVLERYRLAFLQYQPDYIVRLTGDCPLIPPHIISRLIKIALDLRLDYISNVHEDTRMSVDGFDCEVLSSKAFRWLLQNARTEREKEHVTLAIREQMPLGLEDRKSVV